MFITLNNLLSESMRISSGVAILIVISCSAVLIPLTFLLYLRTKREREKYGEEKLTNNKLTATIFNTLIDRRLKNDTDKPKFSVFAISISNYKEICDLFGDGHYFLAIQKTISRIKSVFEGTNKICHYAKDQIFVLVDGLVDTKEIETTANIALLDLTKTIQLVAGVSFNFELNIAVVTNDEINNTREAILHSLEQALVASVKKGANSCVVFSHSLTLGGTEEIRYYKEVKKAIANNEFVLCYQPIVSLSDKKIFAYEALIRWNHKTMGMLQPSKFLKVLEESGNMGWVGVWELETMLSAYQTLTRASNNNDLVLSLNLSQSQLKDEKLFDDMRGVLRKHDVLAEKICFEIMDFNLFDKNETVKANIRLLSEAGFKIAIDNYGLELNSLNMLSKVKIDVLKLDRQFVAGLNQGEFNDNIINMLSVYAVNNNIKMVAIGVENYEIIDKLRDLGVSYGQGYYWGMPKLLSEI